MSTKKILIITIAISATLCLTSLYYQNKSKQAKHNKTSTQANIDEEIIKGDTTLLECPRLSGGNNNYFVTHWANGRVNFSLEYDITRYCPRWVAFVFDHTTSQINHTGRGKWHWDDEIPAQYNISDYYRNSGYDRGHMVASQDRQYSTQANNGTFIYTNICPQTHSFNAGIWKRLEQKVQTWGRNNKYGDIIYIAKGATLDDDKIEPYRLGDKIVIPKYFWMALIAKKNNNYYGIGFIVPHEDTDNRVTIKDLAVSIDDVERFADIDLFHNFPDEVENNVEAQQPNARIARQHWWN